MMSGKLKGGDGILNMRVGGWLVVVNGHPLHYISKNTENYFIATFPILPVDGASRKLTEDERSCHNV